MHFYFCCSGCLLCLKSCALRNELEFLRTRCLLKSIFLDSYMKMSWFHKFSYQSQFYLVVFGWVESKKCDSGYDDECLLLAVCLHS